MDDTIQATEPLTTKVKEWTTDVGLPAVILLTRGSFHCGYVGVPLAHPLYGMKYDTRIKRPEGFKDLLLGKRGSLDILIESFHDDNTCGVGFLFDVHGGVTFSQKGEGSYGGFLSAEYWWFGYDCSHAGDQIKSQLKMSCYHDGIWRDEKYCIAECESLAAQLYAFKNMTVERVVEEIEE